MKILFSKEAQVFGASTVKVLKPALSIHPFRGARIVNALELFVNDHEISKTIVLPDKRIGFVIKIIMIFVLSHVVLLICFP